MRSTRFTLIGSRKACRCTKLRSRRSRAGKEQEHDDRLGYFEDLMDSRTKQAARTVLGKALRTFKDRTLSGIKLEIDTHKKKREQHQIKLTNV